MKRFFYFYLRSMRLYYGFVTGVTTLAGTVVAHSMYDCPWSVRDAVVLCTGFLAWGVNQIFSDWCDRNEDRINAPHRPMVTGELAALPALTLSIVLMVAFAGVSYWAAPWTLAVLAAGGLLNIAYSLLKRVPVLNCVVYGGAITCCFLYGLIGACGGLPPDLSGAAARFLPLILPAHVLMCSFSYYKDKEGDRAAGLTTLQTVFPDSTTLPAHAVLSVLYTCFLVVSLPRFGLWFVIPAVLQLIALTRLMVLLYRKQYHPATGLNAFLCVLWLFSVLTSRNVRWLAVLLVFALIFNLLFRWYPDEKE